MLNHRLQWKCFSNAGVLPSKLGLYHDKARGMEDEEGGRWNVSRLQHFLPFSIAEETFSSWQRCRKLSRSEPNFDLLVFGVPAPDTCTQRCWLRGGLARKKCKALEPMENQTNHPKSFFIRVPVGVATLAHQSAQWTHPKEMRNWGASLTIYCGDRFFNPPFTVRNWRQRKLVHCMALGPYRLILGKEGSSLHIHMPHTSRDLPRLFKLFFDNFYERIWRCIQGALQITYVSKRAWNWASNRQSTNQLFHLTDTRICQRRANLVRRMSRIPWCSVSWILKSQGCWRPFASHVCVPKTWRSPKFDGLLSTAPPTTTPMFGLVCFVVDFCV